MDNEWFQTYQYLLDEPNNVDKYTCRNFFLVCEVFSEQVHILEFNRYQNLKVS